MIDGRYAQPLRNTGCASASGLASWSQQCIVDYLKTARARHTAAFGPMAEVVGNSTQYMSFSDLNAIATYLKRVGGKDAAADALSALFKAQCLQVAMTLLLRRCVPAWFQSRDR